MHKAQGPIGIAYCTFFINVKLFINITFHTVFDFLNFLGSRKHSSFPCLPFPKYCIPNEAKITHFYLGGHGIEYWYTSLLLRLRCSVFPSLSSQWLLRVPLKKAKTTSMTFLSSKVYNPCNR